MSKRKKLTSESDSPANKPKKLKLYQTNEKKKNSSEPGVDNTADKEFDCSWSVADVISEETSAPVNATKSVIKLLEDANTIPFIARYRADMTGNLPIVKLREIATSLTKYKEVREKCKKSYNKLIASKCSDLASIRQSLQTARSVEEIAIIMSPFQASSKGSLAQRARELGLEPLATKILNGHYSLDLSQHVNSKTKGLQTIEDVTQGVKHIIADSIHRNSDVLSSTRNFAKNPKIMINCSEKKAKEDKPSDERQKFQNYFNFSSRVALLQSYQIMAINRGESLKFLTVKIDFGVDIKTLLLAEFKLKWMKQATRACSLIDSSLDDAIKRLIKPSLERLVRQQLAKTGEAASIGVFTTNLRKLLLQCPLRGESILGLDPGFKHGVKYALISEHGNVVDTGVAYIHSKDSHKERQKIIKAMLNTSCEIIAIGNGTACRETEKIISEMIKSNQFGGTLKVRYCIVSEQGSSIYSTSDVAEAELSDLPPNIRSAVSIARRLQNPLAELVKIEPKHLGVGQYQHDINSNLLQSSLDEIVQESVSFVGVDLNTCGVALLRHVAGLSLKRAQNIIKLRDKNGSFKQRTDILKAAGVGKAYFAQCSGFLRIFPNGSCIPEPLDSTSVHPENYEEAKRLIKLVGVSVSEIGSQQFINKINSYVRKNTDKYSLSQQIGTGIHTLDQICKALQQELHTDLRDDLDRPLFKSGLRSMSSLSVGSVVTGRVTNVLEFGAFVDIGVETAGLVHRSKIHARLLNGNSCLELGNTVKVEVLSVDVTRKRVQLKLLELL